MWPAQALLVVLPLLAPGGWTTGEPDPAGQRELLGDIRRVLADLEESRSPEARRRFLALFQRLPEIDHRSAGPDAVLALGNAYVVAAALAHGGDDAFLEALMLASLGPYGRSAEGGEFLSEILWSCLQQSPDRTFAILADLSPSTRGRLVQVVYTQPVGDELDFAGLLTTLEALELPPDLEPIRRQLRIACWDAQRGAFDFDSHVGVVAIGPDGEPCLGIADDRLPTGHPVTLVSGGQRLLSAEIVNRQNGPCRAGSGAATSDSGDSSYRLRLLHPEDGDFARGCRFGILLPTERFALAGDLVHADLDREGATETFRICTSREGLHLSVWTGRPLEGARRWHRYVPAGMEIDDGEGSCERRDYPVAAVDTR